MREGTAKLELKMTSFEGESEVVDLDRGSSKSEVGVAQMESCVTQLEVGAAQLALGVAESPFQTNLFLKGRWLALGFRFSSKK